MNPDCVTLKERHKRRGRSSAPPNPALDKSVSFFLLLQVFSSSSWEQKPSGKRYLCRAGASCTSRPVRKGHQAGKTLLLSLNKQHTGLWSTQWLISQAAHQGRQPVTHNHRAKEHLLDPLEAKYRAQGHFNIQITGSGPGMNRVAATAWPWAVLASRSSSANPGCFWVHAHWWAWTLLYELSLLVPKRWNRTCLLSAVNHAATRNEVSHRSVPSVMMLSAGSHDSEPQGDASCPSLVNCPCFGPWGFNLLDKRLQSLKYPLKVSWCLEVMYIICQSFPILVSYFFFLCVTILEHLWF